MKAGSVAPPTLPCATGTDRLEMRSFGANPAGGKLHRNGDFSAGGAVPVTAKLSKAFYDRFGDDIVAELVEWLNPR